ncbi:inositol monophosphatase family protein [Thermodesulforhabdus norvegica]|uniref:Inositol-1-monophosphatase n=1 Tax=Thermodesulforhabdus norvegica TaxID=39841 RepID=A0A1I4V9F1_9BACT|nr:inositol monophosphatase family protein [Thermodesulforhabdus norvegica]SFM97829.1 myo-inositol-1(or 4)-monophosphatase [Thermodesulforhabdus norvegica]
MASGERSEYDELRTLMEETLIKAGELIKKAYLSQTSSFHHKDKFDYVTETDRNSESLIRKMLNSRYPDDMVIGEETFSGQGLPPEPCWIVDPLDGTTNFIHRFPHISVTIARWDGKDLVAGCIYDVLRNELFTAVKGNGVYLNGSPVVLPPKNDVLHSLVATGFPFKRKDIARQYLASFQEIFHHVSDIRRAGSAALDLAYVAVGRLDGFWEVGLKPWDIAAGVLMIREMGGIVTDFWGTPEVLQSGHVVAARTPELHSLILRAVKKSLAPALGEETTLKTTHCLRR